MNYELTDKLRACKDSILNKIKEEKGEKEYNYFKSKFNSLDNQCTMYLLSLATGKNDYEQEQKIETSSKKICNELEQKIPNFQVYLEHETIRLEEEAKKKKEEEKQIREEKVVNFGKIIFFVCGSMITMISGYLINEGADSGILFLIGGIFFLILGFVVK